MTNLLDSVKDLMPGAIMNKASDLIGLDAGSTTSAAAKFLPAIIGGIINKGNTESGAGSLIDLFKKDDLEMTI